MKPHLQDLLTQALTAACTALGKDTPAVTPVIDATKDKTHGDFASNLAMACAKPLGLPPRKLAEALVANLPASERVAKVEIAGPGFINFFLTGDAVTAVIPEIPRVAQSLAMSFNSLICVRCGTLSARMVIRCWNSVPIFAMDVLPTRSPPCPSLVSSISFQAILALCIKPGL